MMAKKPREPRSKVLLDVSIPGKWILGVVLAIVVLIVVAAIGFASVNRISTCETCHVVKPEVVAYKQTAHYRAGVTCQQCHTNPGVFNYLVKNIQGVTNLILYVSDTYEKPITAVVGDVNCVQCHTNAQLDKDMVVGNIRINHAGLRAAGYQCTTCHANISHPGTRLAISRSAQNPMSICARCHDGKKLPNNCDLCHVNGIPASAPKVKIDLQIKPSQCTECHKSQNFCTKCHSGLQMPHPSDWQSAHGQVVLDRGKSICASCHTKKDPTFCIDCHGLPMPHPASWKTGHGTYALSHQQQCVKCHGENSCLKCHGLQMPHPADWLSQHQSVALNNRALCTKCHTDQFCVNCHGVELPHSAAFIADHPNHVYNQGSVCVKCHGNMGTGPEGCYGGQCHSGSIK